MNDSTDNADYQDRSLILRIIGALMLLVGVANAFIGPVELYCFYLFSEGGPFHYEGFGMGSFMFANIASQIIGYYLIAITFIPLGYAHLKLQRWARPFSLTLLWFWLLMGLPLTLVAYGMYIQAKDPSLAAFLATLPFAVILYPVAPVLLIRLYQSRNVKATFESRDPAPFSLDAIPLAVRVLCLLLVFYILTLHVVILLNGVFPLFGTLLSGLEGIIAIDCAIMALVGLTWGLARLKRWAWWGALMAFCLMTVSAIITFARYTLADILLRLDFPTLEREAFQNIPFQDQHITVPVVLPLLVTVAVIAVARRHFYASTPTGTPAS